MVAKELEEKGRSLIIDGHSFPKVPLPYKDRPERPDICIGTNEHTPKALEIKAVNYFENLGYSVMIDVPFAGGNRTVKILQGGF